MILKPLTATLMYVTGLSRTRHCFEFEETGDILNYKFDGVDCSQDGDMIQAAINQVEAAGNNIQLDISQELGKKRALQSWQTYLRYVDSSVTARHIPLDYSDWITHTEGQI